MVQQKANENGEFDISQNLFPRRWRITEANHSHVAEYIRAVERLSTFPRSAEQWTRASIAVRNTRMDFQIEKAEPIFIGSAWKKIFEELYDGDSIFAE